MYIETTRFGTIEIHEERIFNFKLPVLGFNEESEYVILDLNDDGLFKWLQSIKNPGLAFPLVSVFNLGIDYSIDISDEVIETLQITSTDNLLVLNIASIPTGRPKDTTINLLAPIVFNLKENIAGQIILTGSGYETDYKLFKTINKE